MKKLSYLYAVFALSFTASAQVQNLDFENWDFPVVFDDPAYNRPSGWICTTRWYGFEEVNFSERFVQPVDSSAQNHDYALRLFTYYNYMKDAAVQTAAITDRPAALSGFYKYEENFLIWGGTNYVDTAQVLVVLTKWNANLSKNDTIGKGRFSVFKPESAFTPFEVSIEYQSAAQPDSITIFIDPSVLGRYPGMELQNEAHGGRSVFTVDNLALTGENTAGIKEINNPQELHLHPNPAENQVSFETLSGEVVITDVTGKVVLNIRVQNANTLDVSSLKKGMFILQIRNEKGIYTNRFEKL